jgi:hypothetical protein
MEAVQITVRNMALGPAVFDVVTWSGMPAGSARPASLPAGTTAEVSFVVPIRGTWNIRANGRRVLDNRDLDDVRKDAASFATCRLTIELSDRATNYGCLDH